ncbi:MAG TPA: amidohydrolase family protein, partial [Actinomycetes bacterium]|nr:amidohydrolase family protein [Actinomycetes bacterium]
MSTTLYLGGIVHSPTDPLATAMVVQDDRIAWTGSDAGAAAHRDGVDAVVQLAGALVTPAFVDAHVHTTSTGLALTGLDLGGCTSVADALDRVERHARELRGGVLLGHGWDETSWPEQRPPTRDELDRASYGSVVYLSRVDVHSCLASSALLAATPGVVGEPGYDPSGWLRQDAHHTVRAAAFDSITDMQRRTAQRTALRRAVELGIGTVHELAGPDINGADDLQALLRLAADEPGPEVIAYWGAGLGPEGAMALGAHGAAGDYFVDGAIGSRTALLSQPYSDAATNGVQYLSAAQVRDHVVSCSRAGVQAGFHVIGDGAMAVVAAGFAEAAAEVGVASVRAAHHRLEHVEMLNAEQMTSLAQLGVVASVQPVFDHLWGGDAGMYVTRLGPERARHLNPYAAMVDAGITLAFGSDAPVTPLAPWAAIRAAIAHQTPEHRIDLAAAFYA